MSITMYHMFPDFGVGGFTRPKCDPPGAFYPMDLAHRRVACQPRFAALCVFGEAAPLVTADTCGTNA
jgi:hypothetical protein